MRVRLITYQPGWADEFRRESKLLATLLWPNEVTFEHFGSTSVPGMVAKPVIDMLGIVSDITIIDGQTTARLTDIGYEFGGEWGIPGRRLFRKGGTDRTHHLHFYGMGNPEIMRHLILRNFLRNHPDEVRAYSLYKQQLAIQYPDTREYSVAKHDFVQHLERRALAWKARDTLREK